MARIEALEDLRELLVGLDSWVIRHLDAIQKEVDERFVKRPEDADGEVIRCGDVMTGNCGTKGPVDRMELSYGHGGEFWLVALDDFVDQWARPCDMRHYHKPTVEDVLREFVFEFARDDSELCDDEIIEAFAKRLRLAEDELYV